MRKILILINNLAGKKKTRKNIDILINRIKEEKIEHVVEYSLYSNYIVNRYKEDYKTNYTDVISCGGDGTLHEVINAFHDKNVTITVFPTGSGNDFYATVNKEMDYEELINRIIKNEYREIDVIDNEKYLTINSLGFGLDAETGKSRDVYSKFMPAKTAYYFGALTSFLTAKAYPCKIIIDNKEIDREVMIAVIANGKYFGGSMKISPDSQIDDGLIELIILNKVSRRRLLQLFKQIYRGTHIDEKEVEYYKAKHIKVITDNNYDVQSDGEKALYTPIIAKVKEKYLKIII